MQVCEEYLPGLGIGILLVQRSDLVQVTLADAQVLKH